MPDVTDRVDAIFRAYDRPDSPGCALGVLQDGELVYARGYGMADLEHDVPIGPESVFHVASVSKQFTACLVALLAPEWPIPRGDLQPTSTQPSFRDIMLREPLSWGGSDFPALFAETFHPVKVVEGVVPGRPPGEQPGG